LIHFYKRRSYMNGLGGAHTGITRQQEPERVAFNLLGFDLFSL